MMMILQLDYVHFNVSTVHRRFGIKDIVGFMRNLNNMKTNENSSVVTAT